MTKIGCKNCDRLQSFDQKVVDALIDEQLSLEIDLANQEIVKQRLTICNQCSFKVENTCTKCGCYCRFRASLKHKKCPMDYWYKDKTFYN
ncbi:DUF6171 family protein [Melissococcus plutonius]|uniref:Uncharacterized protein n=1 Tax=Melissococcus plutonius TaxID=33970 RepID=A0A2Z5Y0C0_9ENTE|nr:DUF6171 family protein [Melissococcus plutonius]AIM25479.1 hypothetical protein MEPL_c000960 [Melissococcus plutonius S1]KMT25751.1 hypothetical protein MEPL2_1c00970 [Melissococcus plutonius]KMT27096.1 hypothetical protein MEPL3_1c01240 [Melissococcus plutonius]KMT28197.1 hypothetical protein MEPL1_2c00270 [Melissococcus plutonius]KMT29934.1 hypothetical protein MEPL4_2c00430 [Melissococcus plutonius]